MVSQILLAAHMLQQKWLYRNPICYTWGKVGVSDFACSWRAARWRSTRPSGPTKRSKRRLFWLMVGPWTPNQGTRPPESPCTLGSFLRKNSNYVDYPAMTFCTASNAWDNFAKDTILEWCSPRCFALLTLRDQRLRGMLDSTMVTGQSEYSLVAIVLQHA